MMAAYTKSAKSESATSVAALVDRLSYYPVDACVERPSLKIMVH